MSAPSSKVIKLFVFGLLSFPLLFQNGIGLRSSLKKSFLLEDYSSTLIGGHPLNSIM